MKTLKVHYDPETRWCSLEHPYNKRFVAYVNQGVKPISRRKFNVTTRQWEVHVVYIPQVVAAGKRYFDHVDYSELPENEQIRIVQSTSEYKSRPRMRARPSVAPHAVLFVTVDAPPEVVKAAYRALAQKYHPDHGGDAEEFRRVDAAYKELTK